MRYETIQAKTLLSKPIYGDGWFHSNRSMNAYRGCEHGCVYCDGHCQYYRIDNFYTHIRVKKNASQVLRRELERAGYQSQSKMESGSLVRFLSEDEKTRLVDSGKRKIIVGASGGVSDAYQPAEEEYKITQQVLETLHDFRLPIFILTKSNRILRDLDLLKEIHQQAFVSVCFSITLHDETTRAIIEPKSSATWERFDALKEIRKAGLYGGVMATPTIPTIGDTYENMSGLAKAARNANAEFILFAGMTMKPGRQKDYFFNVIRHHIPENYDQLQAIYANNTYGLPIFDRLPVNVMLQGRRICQEVGIADRSVRHMPCEEPPANVKVLNRVLDFVFYQSMTLGQPKQSWQSYQELAAKIDKGVPDLARLQKHGTLAQILKVSPQLVADIEAILHTDTFPKLEKTIKQIDELAATISSL
jgi:DNA repair photolyase